MKKAAILLILTVIVLSCNTEKAIDYAIVKGKITNFHNDKIYMPNEVRIAADGSFIDTLKTQGGIVGFYDGNNFTDLYLEPGDDLTINYNANEFMSSLTFSGSGAQNCFYLFEKMKTQKEDKEVSAETYLLDEETYKSKMLNDKKALEEKLSSYENLSPKLVNRELRFFNYAYLNKLIGYEGNHRYRAEKKDFKISESFKNEINNDIEKLDFNLGIDFIYSNDFKNLTTIYYSNLTTKRLERDSIPWSLGYLKVLAESPNDTIKNQLAFESVRNEIKYAEDLDLYYNTYLKISTNENSNKIITNTYQQLKTIVKGMPSPKFVDYENNAGGTTSLDDFLGKYVYIDVWATWCGPCKEQIPYLEKVAEKYHGKNIEFVSISVDNDKDYDNWKAMIKEKQMKGIQLLADKQFKSEFVQKYLINGIPRFILIDPNGNIVESAALRPSNNKLIELFDELGI